MEFSRRRWSRRPAARVLRNTEAGRPRYGTGIQARLVALVFLPVTVMGAVATFDVLSHLSAAAEASAIDENIDELSELLTLREALHVLQSAERFDTRFAELGVTRAVAAAFLGFDWTTKIAPARSRAEHAVDELGGNSPISASALTGLYAEIDAGIRPIDAAQRLGIHLGLTGDAVTRTLHRLFVSTEHAPLIDALDALRAANTLLDAATPQALYLSAVWFPSFTDAPLAAATMARFGEASAEYASAATELRELGIPTLIRALGRIQADPRVQAFEDAVAATLRGEPLGQADEPLDTGRVAATFVGYFSRDSQLDQLVTTAITATRDEAQRLAASERSEFLRWAVGSAVVALASIGVALRLARSISEPLRALAAYAHEINDGQLDATPPCDRPRAPREARVAAEVFADLVANLQLLDAKANALAHCDFDDPVLLAPLPGRLGRSLESSVALLSGSIVERDELQTHLAHEATHDSLTGIGNRPAAITALEAAMRRGARAGTATALLFLDLNDFKAVNDSHGHHVGDEVLRQVAGRMSLDARATDFVARLGGDEFVVIAEGIRDVAEATQLGRRMIQSVREPIEIAGHQIRIGAAVGVALTLDGPEEPLRLLARADAAMYRAKSHGGSAIEIFDEDLQREMVAREDIETALTAALAGSSGGGLELHYQPVLDTRSGALVGTEALIRWARPGHGLLPPDSFIPIAEATALIIDVDCWVLGEATRQLVAWSDVAELAGLPVAVNISGRHLLSGRLPAHIRTVLDLTGVDPLRLIIEITETVLLNDLLAAATELDEVRALGVKVAIDDYGTGYTSLGHLQQLPIDILKIDRSFISQLGAERGQLLVRMVTDLGHAIDIGIVAEGVETSEELGFLQAIGADHAQGYLISRPLRPDALAAWAHDHAHAAATDSGHPTARQPDPTTALANGALA